MKKIIFVLAVLAVVSVLVLSGCPEPPNGDSNGNGTPGPANGNGVTEWRPFNFQPGQHFKFNITTAEDTGYVVIDVGQPQGDQYPFHFEYNFGNTSGTADVTTTGNKVAEELMNSPGGAVIAFVLMGTIWHPFMISYAAHGSFGNWTYTQDEKTISWTWGGTGSYAGVSCVTGNVKVDGATVLDSCYSKELGISIFTKVLDEETGELQFQTELAEYHA